MANGGASLLTNFKLTVSYDGTDYAGWQFQANGPTIQQCLEEAIERVTGARLRITGSGRTDAGVHAIGQVANFHASTRLSGSDLLRALNANLPQDIRVLNCELVDESFCALRSAKRKRYTYILQDGAQPDVFRRKYCWHLRVPLDEQAMHQAAQALVGLHDFASFQGAGSERATTVRRVEALSVERVMTAHRGTCADELVISIAANGFLYKMVRNIVGTLVEVGQRRMTVGWPAEVLAKLDRNKAGMTAPPQGLYLAEVNYE